MSLHCDGAAGSCSTAPCLGAAHHNLLWYLEEDVQLHQQSDAGRSGLSWHQFSSWSPEEGHIPGKCTGKTALSRVYNEQPRAW